MPRDGVQIACVTPIIYEGHPQIRVTEISSVTEDIRPAVLAPDTPL